MKITVQNYIKIFLVIINKILCKNEKRLNKNKKNN